MADKKISALTAATTPLAGSEVLPIVQGGSTVKVSIANVTAGRDVGAKNVIATGQGVFAGPLDNFWSASGALYGYYSGGGVFGSYSDAVGTLSPLSFDGSTVAFRTANVSRLEVSNGGDVTTKTGNLVVGTAGKGIDFTANGGDVLTQYDEGSWTPTITASAGTITSYTSSARYTRVGRLVTAVITFKITNVGTASGAIVASLSLPTDAAITYIGSGRDDNTGNMVQGRVVPALPSSVYFATYANASIAATNTEVFFTIQYFV